MLNFLENAINTGDAGSVPGGGGSMIIMLVVMLGVFYFFMIRPENKRKKDAEQIRSSVKNGDKITTIGGVVGTVVDVKEDRIVIETSADQVRVELMKWAISTNETATARAAAEAKKDKEEKAKKMAEKRANKNK